MRLQGRGTCLFCGKTFGALFPHLLTHIQEKPFFCCVCPKEFSEPSNKIRHDRIHSGERPFTCDVCQKSFLTKTHLVMHKTSHVDERDYGCSSCDKSFKRQQTLNDHINAKHTMEKSYKCTLCPSSFTTAPVLWRHKKIHEKKRPFKCSKCSKSFKRKDHLSRHVYIHLEGSKRFCCNVCPSKFTYKSSLNDHKKRVHMNVEDRKHSCELCGKKFANYGCLEKYMRKHALERPYKCIFCKNPFLHSNDLQNHLRTVHLRENPFICSLCGKEFGRASGLNYHIIYGVHQHAY